MKSYPPIRFIITIKGAEEMNYRIGEHGPICIVGISQRLYSGLEQNFTIVPQMWQKSATDRTLPRLAAVVDGQPMGLLGVSVFRAIS